LTSQRYSQHEEGPEKPPSLAACRKWCNIYNLAQQAGGFPEAGVGTELEGRLGRAEDEDMCGAQTAFLIGEYFSMVAKDDRAQTVSASETSSTGKADARKKRIELINPRYITQSLSWEQQECLEKIKGKVSDAMQVPKGAHARQVKACLRGRQELRNWRPLLVLALPERVRRGGDRR